ncbi:CinA family protein [Pseudochryseolinea flava]|uniref:Damage-inducible protein CinA n=1 Tax=Pseudochryseolinea flava TaxID=2059302 RepID=A0A364XWV6_9BACT|nr:nicotinamide-nucleotide amidohydrolase family protein [Pseudochryseolinea flava]RAV98714.1 damage-inducible protein CinA [Pseudochryseolinea flava]
MYDAKVISGIKNTLIKRGETIAVAESVTAGHLQAAISQADFAKDFFQGGITVYNIGQKSRHLWIDPIRGEACNCVSAEIAGQMATGACKLFSCDWGISITGYAAPVPELGIEKLFAFYAVAFRGDVKEVKRIKSSGLSPVDTQVDYTNAVLKRFQKMLRDNH